MILFFTADNKNLLAVQTVQNLSENNIEALEWLFSGARLLKTETVEGIFIGPRKEMITPWSTSAVEICQNIDRKSVV